MKMRLVLAVLAVIVCSSARAASISVETKRVSANGRMFSAHVVRIPLDSYRVRVGLAGGRIGATEPLAAIAKRYSAVAAINGSFFDAYNKGPIKAPYHNLISGGQVLHIGDTGTTLGFDANGSYRMDRASVRIKGQLPDTPGANSWYAYLVNHPGGATLYNRYWVGAKTPAEGTQVVVRDGVVQSTGTGSRAIPSDGYVLVFGSGEGSLGSRFRSSAACQFRTQIQADDQDFWANVKEAIGCGPRLVSQGRIACEPQSEGFSSPKILSISGQRSAVGITSKRELLLVTCGATVYQLAGVMKALGAYDAMNLDGGASSGLWANGRYITSPGRNVSNALLVVKKS